MVFNRDGRIDVPEGTEKSVFQQFIEAGSLAMVLDMSMEVKHLLDLKKSTKRYKMALSLVNIIYSFSSFFADECIKGFAHEVLVDILSIVHDRSSPNDILLMASC